jgi:hypothetical protein
MIPREGVTLETWEAAVRRTVANPPGWVDGRPLVLGDVFGERAAERALAAASTGKNNHGGIDRSQYDRGIIGGPRSGLAGRRPTAAEQADALEAEAAAERSAAA